MSEAVRRAGMWVRGSGTLGAVLGAAAVVTFVLWQVSPRITPVTYDESNLVYDGQRLMAGQVPYRDFFSFLPPGSFYLMSGWPWGWWGHPETGVRYLTALFVLGAWAVAWLRLRKAGGGAFPAGLVAALLPVTLFPFAGFSPHHWMAVGWFTAVIAAASVLWESPGSRWRWALLGALSGAACAFLQTEGAASLVVLALTLLLTSAALVELARRGAWALGGLACSALFFYGPLAAAGAGPDTLHHVVGWTLSNYRRPGNVNYQPFLVDLPLRLGAMWRFEGVGAGVAGVLRALAGTLLFAGLLALSAACLAAALWVLAGGLRRRRLPAPGLLVAAVLTLFAVGVFNYSGPGWVHWVYLLPPVILVWALAAARAGLKAPWLRAVRWGAAGLLACGVLCHGALLTTHLPEGWEFWDVDRPDRESPLNVSLRASPLLGPGDSLVVLPTGGNVYLYTYPAAIGYTYLFPLEDGYNSPEDHELAARQIRSRRPPLVLIHKLRYGAFAVKGDPLWKVLEEDYAPLSENQALVVLARKRGNPPAPSEGSP